MWVWVSHDMIPRCLAQLFIVIQFQYWISVLLYMDAYWLSADIAFIHDRVNMVKLSCTRLRWENIIHWVRQTVGRRSFTKFFFLSECDIHVYIFSRTHPKRPAVCDCVCEFCSNEDTTLEREANEKTKSVWKCVSSSWSYWRDRYYYVFLSVWSTTATTTTTKPTTTATVRLRIRHSPSILSLIVVCYFCYFARLFRYGRQCFRQSALSLPPLSLSPPLLLTYIVVAITTLRISLCIFVIRSPCVCVSLISVNLVRALRNFSSWHRICVACWRACLCVCRFFSLSFILFSVSGKYVQINLYFFYVWYMGIYRVGRLEFQF